jgi:acyl dehydratase
MTAPESLISEEMRSRIGIESVRVSDPIDKSLIRQWALALSWPEAPDPLFWDEEYAKTTRFGGIIAPPFFNPFSYNINPQRVRQMSESSSGTRQSAPVVSEPQFRIPSGLNAGGEAEHTGIPIRPGDVITATSRTVDMFEKTGRTAGRMVVTLNENRWTNQKGELVRIYRGTSIRY